MTIKKYLLFILFVSFLTGCGQDDQTEKMKKVGMLVPDTIHDQVWGTKGYKGLLKIQSEFNSEVYYLEGIEDRSSIIKAIKEFDEKGITLIFGHGNQYATTFNEVAKDFPHIHFVCFNSTVYGENVTSLNFNSNAMGFFAGMVAANMTSTNNVGVLAAFEWQPEVDGFFEGAYYENPNVNVHIEFTQNWDDAETALKILDGMLKAGVDVVYPAGDGYNIPVINELKDKGLFTIGYVSNQSDLGENTVLTSTIQHVPELYELVAKRFLNGELASGSLYFDFNDEVISLGTFSPLVEEEFKNTLLHHIEKYKETGLLPNEL